MVPGLNSWVGRRQSQVDHILAGRSDMLVDANDHILYFGDLGIPCKSSWCST